MPSAEVRFGQTYTVRLRKNETGEIVTRYMGDDITWHESSMYWWTDGNFGCDCNRALTFERGTGKSEDEVCATDIECSEGRFTVIDVTLADGTVIPIDD